MESIVRHVSTRRKLKKFKPTRVRRCGFLKLGKMYEYDFNSEALYRQAVRENPDVIVHRAAGIIGGGV